MSPIEWHAHEMVFGFTPAIIAGFLLTAVPKWTGVDTPTGIALAGLFGLWVAGRLAMASAEFIPYAAVAVVDVLFLPAVAVAIAIPIGRTFTARNLGFIPLLFGLALANAVFHLHYIGVVDVSPMRAIDAGLGIIVVIIAIVGGRVIPFFTANAASLEAPDRRRLVDLGAIALTVGWLIAFLSVPETSVASALALAAGAANLGRMVGWGTTKSLGIPLLWVLHAGYVFVGIGLVTLGLSGLDVAASRSLALHALSAGAIGILCLGMMARVSLGHTGRTLKTPPAIVAAFVLIVAAAATRVFVPWAWPDAYGVALVASAVAWTMAWGLFVVVYTPILCRRRADGRPG